MTRFDNDIAWQLMQKSDESRWTTFCEQKSQGTIYHSLAWRNLLISEYGFSPQYYMGTRDGKVVGVFPAFMIKNLTGAKLISLPYSMYGGPVLSDDAKTAFAQFVDHLYQTARVKKLTVWSDSELPTRTLRCIPGEVDSFIELKEANAEQYFEKLHYKVKYEIRKAEGQEFKIKTGNDDGLFENFYALFFESRKRLKLPVPQKSYLRRLSQEFDADFIVIESDASPVSAGLILYHGKHAYNVYNATTTTKKKANPGYSLYVTMITRSFERRRERLYLGGSPHKQLLAFKSKWEPVTRQTYSITNKQPEESKIKAEGIPYWDKLPNKAVEMGSYFLLRYIY